MKDNASYNLFYIEVDGVMTETYFVFQDLCLFLISAYFC